MRKLAALLLLLPLVLAGMPASADTPTANAVQTVEGSIALPTRFTNPEQGFPGLGRRLWLLNPATNGTAMYVFDVDPKTWGGAFEITDVGDATGEADLGIYFYTDFGTVGGLLAGDPGAAVTTAEYDVRAAGGEKGFIPPGSKRGLVFTYNGVASTFTYKASPMPVISLASGNLDLTVANGAYVGWVNDTDDYAFVERKATSSAQVPFSSGSGPASGMRKGEVFVHQFTRNGTWSYEAGHESAPMSGAITVTPGPGAGPPAS